MMLAGRHASTGESVSVDQAYLFVGYGDTELQDVPEPGPTELRAVLGLQLVVGEVSSAADRGSDRETTRVCAHGHDY